jgi:ATP-dependent DNA ligase
VVPDGRAGEVQGAESQRLVRDALRWCVTHYQGAFDLLELNGADLSKEPIEVRKATLRASYTRVGVGCA